MLGEWAYKQEPVFIMGPERSGTSLLFQQVSNHPDFCDFSHATVETFCFVKPWLLLQESSPENYEIRVYLGKNQLEQFQESISPLIERNKMLNEQGMSLEYLNQANKQEIWYERRYKHVIRAFFYHSWKNLGEKRLVEKTPAHIRCVKEILDAFPKAKLLICTRDPSEIIASHKKRYLKEIELGKRADDPSIDWLSHSTEKYLKYFLNIDRIINILKKNDSDKMKLVPYGDLTLSPTNTLQDVFTFIGSNYSAVNSVNTRHRNEQAWDPLLNQAPQKNIINVNDFIPEYERDLIAEKAHLFSDFWR